MSIIILIVFSIFISCKENKNGEEINGHWHLYNNEYVNKDFFYKLDIVEDSSAYLDGVNYVNFNKKKHSIELGKNILTKKKRLLLWIEGMYYEFNYLVKNDSIFLSEVHEKGSRRFKYYGIRRDQSSCNTTIDVYSSHRLLVDLPKTSNTDEIRIKDDFSNCFNVYFGYDKFDHKKKTVFLNDVPFKKESFDLSLEKFRIKIPKDKIKRIYSIFNIDTSISKEEVSPILKLVKEKLTTEIYQRKLTKNGDIVLVKMK